MQKLNGLDESKLIKRLKLGDQTAFEILFRYYYPGLVVFASQITLDKDEAAEIVQDFFVRLWEKRSGIKDNSSLKSYFFTSVKNRSLNYLKKIEIQSHVIDQLKSLTENNQLYQPDIFVESELQEKIKAFQQQLEMPTKGSGSELPSIEGFIRKK